ncbi:MAG: hypothetical protein JNL98_22535 [Bryobacterales bacterium]|nr:hypothetical protein [Bryobacterales bacterium]
MACPPRQDVGRQTPLIPDITFDDSYQFELGGVKFELHHTPGETPDHLSVWIPQWKAAFPGDNIYDSFPNLYTLRGTRPRWPLEYIASLDKVRSWNPELLLPSHGQPVKGASAVQQKILTYTAAIRHVHDATVKGMNEGKDVFTLMREVNLPAELRVGEGYGNLPWSVRGIYEGYAGWFDGNPASMYATPPKAVYPDLVEMAGGAAKVAARARQHLNGGKTLEALHLADAAIEADPESRPAWRVRIEALRKLLSQSRNSNERGWLNAGIREAQAKLKE